MQHSVMKRKISVCQMSLSDLDYQGQSIFLLIIYSVDSWCRYILEMMHSMKACFRGGGGGRGEATPLDQLFLS